MPVVKACLSCNKPLTGYRSHAVTCGSTCRGIQWRSKKETMLPVRLMFNTADYSFFAKAADASGVSIDQYLLNRLAKTMEALPW